MPTRLRNLKIKRVALVDEGANPDAFVRFAKSKAPVEDEAFSPDEAKGILKRFAELISKAFGGGVEKAAFTFAEGEEKRDYERVMDSEIYPMHWAFMDSVRSILTDTEKDDGEKATLLKQSLSEFNAAFSAASESWAKAERTETAVKKDANILEKMRDHLDSLIKQSGCSGKKPKVTKADDDDDHDNEDGADDDEPPVRKGAIDMKFDTSKMTQEEKATYEDLAKRFGSEEAPTPTSAPASAPAAALTTTDQGGNGGSGDDVYKGIHPTVKAELENLRKFREEQELRQYTEVAKKYTLLGKKPEELAPVLKSLKDTGGTAYDDMIGILDSNLEAVEKSGAFGEIGKRGSADTGNDAWSKIEAAAQEVMKSKPDMQYADAIDTACIQHPELLEAYEKSRR